MCIYLADHDERWEEKGARLKAYAKRDLFRNRKPLSTYHTGAKIRNFSEKYHILKFLSFHKIHILQKEFFNKNSHFRKVVFHKNSQFENLNFTKFTL